MGRPDVQTTEEEDARYVPLAPGIHLQSPDDRPGHRERGDVEENLNGTGGDIHSVLVNVSGRLRVPIGGYRDRLEKRGEEESDEPAHDQAAHDVYGGFEPFGGEEAAVEK